MTRELLTLDEARDQLGTSALALVEAVSCSPARLARLLGGKGTARNLPPAARQAVMAHRSVLRQVLASDHAWIFEEQLEGALSYAECHQGPWVAAAAA
ncbi:MAG: hypothetical protein M3011_12780 [Actinomycetota bacterium]|nr:hypothetical protein [Actinomycetota bacterium]